MYMEATAQDSPLEFSYGQRLKANEHLMSDVSIGKFIRNVYLQSGFDVSSWYEDYGMSPEQFEHSEARFPHELTSIIWEKVEHVSRKPSIGLQLADSTTFPTNHLLYYLTCSS